MEAIIRVMGEGRLYCLWILFSDSDSVKTEYNLGLDDIYFLKNRWCQ